MLKTISAEKFVNEIILKSKKLENNKKTEVLEGKLYLNRNVRIVKERILDGSKKIAKNRFFFDAEIEIVKKG
jgi:hypothetical protein